MIRMCLIDRHTAFHLRAFKNWSARRTLLLQLGQELFFQLSRINSKNRIFRTKTVGLIVIMLSAVRILCCVLTIAAAMLLGGVQARPWYPARIPNSGQVPNPYGIGTCPGVGHLSCSGGGERNPFGKDFEAIGNKTWTKELCHADSDGDGFPNGVELGDPCCNWKPGETPPITDPDALGHPGFAESTPIQWQAANCLELEEDTGGSSDFPEEGDADFFETGEQRMSIDLVFNNEIPANETTYLVMPFNLSLPRDVLYHLVGVEYMIDEFEHLHHFVIDSCGPEFNASGSIRHGEGHERNLTHGAGSWQYQNNCSDIVLLWAPGTLAWAAPRTTGFRIGQPIGKEALAVEVHYDNPERKEGLVDRSRVRLHFTPDLRMHDIGILMMGPALLNRNAIPPLQDSFYFSSRTLIDLDDSASVKVIGWAPHMHYRGTKQFVERVDTSNIDDARSRTNNGGSTDDAPSAELLAATVDYDANLQWMHPVDMVLSTGDLILTTCVFNTSQDQDSVHGGYGTHDEMCVNFIWYYPAKAVPNRFPPHECGKYFCTETQDGFSGVWPENATSAMQVPPLRNALLMPSDTFVPGPGYPATRSYSDTE